MKSAITKEQILSELEKFNHLRGKIVTVHTSLKAVGDVDGEVLLSALIDFFARDGGLLCIPTHTWDKEVYDRREAYTSIGVLPSLAAEHSGGVRTLHPTHSMAVFGEKEKVEKFIENEAEADTPANPKGCYGKLYEEDGYVLLIGVGQDKNTYLHCVEEMLDVPDRLTDYKVEKTIIHKDGQKEKRFLYWFDEKIPDVSIYFPKFEEPFRHSGCIEDALLGNARVQICSARKMYNTIKKIYENNGFGELLDNDNPIDKKRYL